MITSHPADKVLQDIRDFRHLLKCGEAPVNTWFVAFGFFLGRGYLPTDAEHLADEVVS